MQINWFLKSVGGFQNSIYCCVRMWQKKMKTWMDVIPYFLIWLKVRKNWLSFSKTYLYIFHNDIGTADTKEPRYIEASNIFPDEMPKTVNFQIEAPYKNEIIYMTNIICKTKFQISISHHSTLKFFVSLNNQLFTH